MKNDIIVTIAREHGSGGRSIGKKLAERMNVPFYDRELIYLAAKESGLSENFIKEVEEKPSRSFIYNMYMTGQALSVSDQVFIAQTKVITEMADKGSCVIVGRCSDYILKDRKNCKRVFIYAPFEERVCRVRDEYNECKRDVEQYLEKLDKKRSAYYASSTMQKWGVPQNYDLCINSAIGIDETVDVILEFLEKVR